MSEILKTTQTRGVLFDLGGTLVRYINNPDHQVYMKFMRRLGTSDTELNYYDFKAMVERHWSVMQKEYYSAPPSLSINEFNKQFLMKEKLSEETAVQLAPAWSDLIFEMELAGTVLVKGVKRFLDWLNVNGFMMGVITNASHSEERIRKLMKKVEIEKYFDTIVVSSVVGVKKPDPKIFQIALDNLGLKPEQAVYIGDREEYDAKGAKNAGIRWVIIDESMELEEMIELIL